MQGAHLPSLGLIGREKVQAPSGDKAFCESQELGCAVMTREKAAEGTAVQPRARINEGKSSETHDSERRRRLSTADQLDLAERNLDRIIEWVPKHESRAFALLALVVGLLGSEASALPHVQMTDPSTIVAVVSSAAFALVALAQIVRGTFPKTKGGGKSLFYFGTIAALEPADFAKRFRAKDGEAHLDDLLAQTHRNAEIVDSKFRSLRIAFIATLLALPGWLWVLMVAFRFGGGNQ